MNSEGMSFHKLGENQWVFKCVHCKIDSSPYKFESIARKVGEAHTKSNNHITNKMGIVQVEPENSPAFIQKVVSFMNQHNILDYAEALVAYKIHLEEQSASAQIMMKEERDRFIKTQENKHNIKTSIFRQIKEDFPMDDMKFLVKFIEVETGLNLSSFIQDPIELAWLYHEDIDTLNPDTFEYKFSHVANVILGYTVDTDTFNRLDFTCCHGCTMTDQSEMFENPIPLEVARKMYWDMVARGRPIEKITNWKELPHDPPVRMSEYYKVKRAGRILKRLIHLSNTFIELMLLCFNDSNKKNYKLERNNNFIEALYYKPKKLRELMTGSYKHNIVEDVDDDASEEDAE
jgi:hypothetical protein